jgi:hypothetical protein
LLEGLEISVLSKSAAFIDNPNDRLDSEYFRSDILKSFALIGRCCHERLNEIVERVQHPNEVVRTYEDEGLHIVLAQNVRDNTIEFNERVFMSPTLAPDLAANRLKQGDVLMTRSGANFGQASAWKEDGDAFACADLLVFRQPKCPSGYLSTFFCTSHGKLIIERGAYGMAQPHIAPTYLEQIAIPRFGNLEVAVDGLVNQSVQLKPAGPPRPSPLGGSIPNISRRESPNCLPSSQPTGSPSATSCPRGMRHSTRKRHRRGLSQPRATPWVFDHTKSKP